jgi:hypothetical protein
LGEALGAFPLPARSDFGFIYIKNYNDGRPFILASHSQGPNVMIYLLAEYMKDNPEVYSRMVAAPLIFPFTFITFAKMLRIGRINT